MVEVDGDLKGFLVLDPPLGPDYASFNSASLNVHVTDATGRAWTQGLCFEGFGTSCPAFLHAGYSAVYQTDAFGREYDRLQLFVECAPGYVVFGGGVSDVTDSWSALRVDDSGPAFWSSRSDIR